MTTFKGKVSSGGVQTTPAPSTSQQLQREVWEKIIFNYARDAVLIAMIANGEIGADGMTSGPGLINKRIVKNAMFESFNYTPPDVTTTATAALSGTTLYCDTTNIKFADTLFNTDNDTNARVDSVTSASECEITSVGATAFAVATGDRIMINATAYPENSVDPSIFTKNFDQVYNTLQISREPVAISNTMTKEAFYATNDYFKLLKKVNFINFMDKIERTFLFGQRASSGLTTAGGASLTNAFRTTRGVYNWAAQRYDMKGNLSMFKIRSEIPMELETVSSTQKAVWLLGKGALGRVNEMMNNQAMYTISGAESPLKKYGITTRKIATNNMDIELVPHKAFDRGGMATKGLLIVPEMLSFVHLEGRDIHPVVGEQANDRDGKIDEVQCEAGCQTLDGGQSILVTDNLY